MKRTLLRSMMIVLYLIQLTVLPTRAEPASSTTPVSMATLNDIQIQGEDVVLNFSQLMPYDVYMLENPWRLVVEIPDVRYKAGFDRKTVSTSLVSRIRGYQYKENPLVSRVILDLKAPVDYKTAANESSVKISLVKNTVLDEKSTKGTTGRQKSPRKYESKMDLLQSLPKEVVTLDFEGTDIKDVIRLMSETSNVNIIFGPEVSGTISIHLRDVPFDEAFRTILNLKGLVASQLGSNVLRVTTPDILARERTKSVLFTKTIPVNYVKADEMQMHIQSVMATNGRKGTITIVPESNSLVITDSEEGIAQSEILIAQLDKRPKQVMIEARIMEMRLDNGFDLGVQWEYAATNATQDGFRFLGAPTDETTRVTWKQADGTTIGAVTPFKGAGTGVSLPAPIGSGGAISFGFVQNDKILSATLSALVTQSKAKVLSSPKVVTLNGQEAKIEATDDIPFNTQTISNGTVSNAITMINAGIKLNVTPTINAENRITLIVKPEASFPDYTRSDTTPTIRKRQAQTTVVVKDGDTLVIGGLISDDDQKTVAKIPLLGDIPIIGIFFRQTHTSKRRNELLVFVTPRIIRD